MIDIEKMIIPASCEISALTLYLVQENIIKPQNYIEVCTLYSKCFGRIIHDYNEKENNND